MLLEDILHQRNIQVFSEDSDITHSLSREATPCRDSFRVRFLVTHKLMLECCSCWPLNPHLSISLTQFDMSLISKQYRAPLLNSPILIPFTKADPLPNVYAGQRILFSADTTKHLCFI